MAQGYTMDPETGLPMLRTLGGGALPLPLSAQDMAAAGAVPWAEQVPPLPPELEGLPPGALAQQVAPGSRTVRRDVPAGMPSAPQAPGTTGRGNYSPQQIEEMRPKVDRTQELEQERAALEAKAQDPAFRASGRAMASLKLAQDKNRAELEASKPKPKAAAPGAVDPSELARPGEGGGGAAPEGGSGGGMDPAVEQVFREALGRGGGGGGPARLGVTGQTVKYTVAGDVPEEVSAEAEGARMAREGFDLELADRADARREQLFAVRQAEAAARMADIQAQQVRRDEQQRMLDEYATKRDTLVQEAASLKAPEMADYWGSKSDFATMMTAVSIAIGGALQGLRGGPNPGLEMSNQAIDRWMVSKREEYERASDQVDRADNQFARMVQTFGSENLAAANMREQAYAVRDAMLTDYAEQMGTAPAKDAAAQLLLAQQQQRAEGKAQAYAAATKEVEEKLSMTGGGGGGSPRLLKALSEAAQAKKYLDELNGTGSGTAPTREVQTEKVDALASSLDAINAARNVRKHIGSLGYADSDADDPTSGAYDAVASSIPGSDRRRLVQDLEQDTFVLARGAQATLGKSDNDAVLAERWAAGGGGSGRERVRAATTIERKALSKAQAVLASLTPAQRRAYIAALPPEHRELMDEVAKSVANPKAAPSERPVE